MVDGVFNVAKGRVNALVQRVVDNDPVESEILVVLLQAAEADATLVDRATLSALLAEAGNTEATFTNYARIGYTDTDLVAPTVDNTNDWQQADIPDPQYSNAGGAVNNALVKMLVCYDPDGTGGTDADIIPLTHQDITITTDGNAMRLQIDANGFFRAS